MPGRSAGRHRGADDVDARSDLMLAAIFAGMGLGNAGVHLPHANGNPIAGQVRDYRAKGYPLSDEPIVPHGQAVSLTAPESFGSPSTVPRSDTCARRLDPRSDCHGGPREQLPGHW